MEALLTREPGGTRAGERIRGLLLDPTVTDLDRRAEVLLMLAARAQHVSEVIGPALGSGRHVVCDRFSGSTLAYQGYGRGLDLGELATLSSWASEGVEPDRVILIQVDLAVAARRAADRGLADRMEGEGADFFARVQQGYLALAERDPDRWRVVDGSGPPEAVAELVAAAAA
jgi:dTMP kinase